MKYIVFIGDGMADNPVEALGGKTPLEYANIPGIDSLAKAGELGSVRTVPEGVPPGSDTAILSIFGYDPRKFFSGRSPLEAAGSGVKLKPGDISYRCNMVALSDDAVPYEQKRILSHNGGSVHGEDALGLMAALLADPEFAAAAEKDNIHFNVTPTFRHIAVQQGANLEGIVLELPHEHLDEVIGPLQPSGNQTAQGLKELQRIAHKVLDGHPINQARRAAGKLPANGIWFWAEGQALDLPSFEAKHHKKGMVVSAVPLVRGIGALTGFDTVEVPGATGELDTNYEGKADATVQALADGYDLVVLHVEAPDECTHNGDTPDKIQAIEWLNSRVLPRLEQGLGALGEPWRMLVLSDHKTLTSTRGHDGDPVPYIIYDSRRQAPGSGLPYTEKEAANGPLILKGHTLIDRLLEEA